MATVEKLTYMNERGESLVFSRASLYHVNLKDVSGLSDIQNSIYSITSMGQDGDTYIGGRIESRNIEIVGYIRERDKSRIQTLRRNMNHILNPQFTAVLVYEFRDHIRVINCNIDNAPIFKREPIFEQFTIQLFCGDPFWREALDTREDIAAWIGGMEFLEPEGLEIIESDVSWEIGFREPSLIVNVYNGGDVRTGIRIEFRAQGEAINPLLLNVNTQEFIKLNMEMDAGDVLTVTTGFGQKSITLTRAGISTDAFRYLDVDSTYLQLAVGDNLFRYDAGLGLDNLEVTIFHNNLYLGV